MLVGLLDFLRSIPESMILSVNCMEVLMWVGEDSGMDVREKISRSSMFYV